MWLLVTTILKEGRIYIDNYIVSRAQKGDPAKSAYTVGVSTTGCGEHLVRTFLAKECAQHLRSSRRPLLSLQNCMREKFAESDFLSA